MCKLHAPFLALVLQRIHQQIRSPYDTDRGSELYNEYVHAYHLRGESGIQLHNRIRNHSRQEMDAYALLRTHRHLGDYDDRNTDCSNQ